MSKTESENPESQVREELVESDQKSDNTLITTPQKNSWSNVLFRFRWFARNITPQNKNGPEQHRRRRHVLR